MTHYESGVALERQVKKEREQAGSLVIRSAGSKGKVDLIIFSPFIGEVCAAQCKCYKTAKPKPPKEFLELREKYGINLLWITKKRGSKNYLTEVV